MDRYLFYVTEVFPPADHALSEPDADPREREAARLEVAPARPGEDPPTTGDEGGGNPFPEPEAPRPGLLRRLARSLRLR